MTKLEWAALFAGLNILLLVVLMFHVVGARRRHKVTLGDGGNPDVLRAIRAHGNAAESIPPALIGLGFMALLEPVPVLAVIVLGGGFTLGRVLHFSGLAASEGPSFGRVVGTLLTVFTLIGMAGALLYGAVSPLL